MKMTSNKLLIKELSDKLGVKGDEDMKKKIVTASIVSATVGAAVGAAAIAVSKKENRDKATKAVNDLRKTTVNTASKLYKSAKVESKKALSASKKIQAVKSTPKVTKKAVVKKATRKAAK